ncbi:MAG: hypothetical protein IJ222_03735 [Bacteroidales bacterium]|nr:hypothetical protein [Bacteroidales bacterium]
MKKFSKLFLVLAAACTVSAVSCKKDNGGSTNGTTDDFSDVVAEYAAQAQKIDLPTETDQVITTNDGAKVKTIEFTESGYAIITKLVPVKVRADEDVTYEEVVFVTTFTVNGTTYTVDGFGTVTVSTSNGTTTVSVTATSTGGDNAVSESVEVPAENVTASTSTNDLFKSWKIYVTEVSAKGGSLGNNAVEKKFTGTSAGSLDEIAVWLKDKGVKFDEQINGYVIESVTLTDAGTFLVKFNKQEPYKGDFKLSGKNFSYKFEGEGNSVLNGEANGTVEVKDGVCTLLLNGTVKNGSDTYTTVIKLTLHPIAKV